MTNLVLLVGPTASGKTALSIQLAKALDGEIISGDSMQFYRGMDIGTAKVTPEEMSGVPHHLIDIIQPDQPYSVADFQRDCYRLVEEIAARGKSVSYTHLRRFAGDGVKRSRRFTPFRR